MRRVEFRSLVIGLLGGVCIFLMMGQNRGNMGDIVVNSIEVRDDGNGGFIRTFNSSGEKTTYLGTSEGDAGMLGVFSKNGDETIFVGTSKEQGGVVMLNNKYNNEVVYLGPNKYEDGMIFLSTSNGEMGWAANGAGYTFPEN